MLISYYNSFPNSINYSVYTNVVPLLFVFFMALTFNKAGEKWWKALIPFYRKYVVCNLAKCTDLFVQYVCSTILWITELIGFLIYIATAIVMPITVSMPSVGGFSLIFVVLLIAITIYKLIIDYKIAKNLSVAFGGGDGMAIGLFLFPTIFYGIIALDDSRKYRY